MADKDIKFLETRLRFWEGKRDNAKTDEEFDKAEVRINGIEELLDEIS